MWRGRSGGSACLPRRATSIPSTAFLHPMHMAARLSSSAVYQYHGPAVWRVLQLLTTTVKRAMCRAVSSRCKATDYVTPWPLAQYVCCAPGVQWALRLVYFSMRSTWQAGSFGECEIRLKSADKETSEWVGRACLVRSWALYTGTSRSIDCGPSTRTTHQACPQYGVHELL